MLRSTIIQASLNVIDLLQKTQLGELVENTIRPDKKQTENPIVVYTKLIKMMQGFGEAEEHILEAVGLSRINSPSLWEQLLRVDKSGPSGDDLVEVFQGVRFSRTALPKILNLLKRENDPLTSSSKTPGEKKHADDSKLTVIIIEDSGPSTPERLSLMLTSIQGFYQVFDTIDPSDTKLSVANCDSGSDKAFDFLGAAKLVQQVKELILSLWDNVVYYRESKSLKHLDIISKSLPVIERINTLEQEKKLEPEHAEILRRQIGLHSANFLNCGAIIPELDTRKTHEPRLLMKPEVKLLASGAPTASAEESSPVDPDSGHDQTANDSDEMEAFIKKAAAEYKKIKKPRKVSKEEKQKGS